MGSSPAKYFLAAASLITTTFGVPRRSASAKNRPRFNGTRNVLNQLGDTQCTPTIALPVAVGGLSANVMIVPLQPLLSGAQSASETLWTPGNAAISLCNPE